MASLSSLRRRCRSESPVGFWEPRVDFGRSGEIDGRRGDAGKTWIRGDGERPILPPNLAIPAVAAGQGFRSDGGAG